MKWTPYAPILPGFYWAKCKSIMSGKEYLQVVKVYSTDGGPINMAYIEGDNYEIKKSICTANITHFSDVPIAMPEET